MVARNVLPLSHYEAHKVLAPVREGETALTQAVRVVVFAPNFPQRAIEPELLVGQQFADRVSISHDQRSLRGLFFKMPAEGEVIRVRYGDSQEGELRERFTRESVRALPKTCEE
jgi:hypothetical protein